MKRTLFAIFFVLGWISILQAEEYVDVRVIAIYAVSDTEFRFQTETPYTIPFPNRTIYLTDPSWFSVDEKIVGATKFNLLHAQLLAALVHQKKCWVGTTPTTRSVIQATIYRQ